MSGYVPALSRALGPASAMTPVFSSEVIRVIILVAEITKDRGRRAQGITQI
jgi:hypothetical protein